MERRNERIEALLERYFDAQTTVAEEQELREFFTCGQEIPRELQYARTMFSGLEMLAGEKAGARDNQTGAELFTLPERRRGMRMKIWVGAVAAAVAAVGIFVLVSYLNRPYCYINGIPVRDAETAMQATVYFEQLEALDKPMYTLDGIMQQIQKEKI